MGRQLILAACLAVSMTAQADRLPLPEELWARPRSGDLILAQPLLKQSVEALLEDPGARLRIYYGKGDEAMLQAEELRAWLIALAVDGSRIELIGDGSSASALSLEVVATTVMEEKHTNSKGSP